MSEDAGKNQNPGFDDETKRRQKEQQSINELSVERSNTVDDQVKKPSQSSHDVESDAEQTRDQAKDS